MTIRGSIYYQSSQLVKQIFNEGTRKVDRVNPNHPHYQMVASYKTMESYRNIWNNFFNYLKEHWKINNCELISHEHITAYMDYKIEYHPSKQYLEKISAALGKLEVSLTSFARNIHNEDRKYDFSIRQVILDSARDLDLVADNYHSRAYTNPNLIIQNLNVDIYKLAASIQYEGGARIEGIALITKEQLLGIKTDLTTNKEKGIIWNKEKGGKEGEVLVNIKTYDLLKEYIKKTGKFKINRQKYYNDLKQACLVSNEIPEGSHGFRWNFAKRRMFEYAQAGYSYHESLQKVSHEMKHNRSSITEHYLF